MPDSSSGIAGNVISGVSLLPYWYGVSGDGETTVMLLHTLVWEPMIPGTLEPSHIED